VADPKAKKAKSELTRKIKIKTIPDDVDPREYPIADPAKTVEAVLTEINLEGEIITPNFKRLFNQGNKLSQRELALRDEMAYIIYDLEGSQLGVQRRTGLSPSTLKRILKERQKAIEETPGMPQVVLGNEIELEEVRFTGRKQLIDLCFDGALKALTAGVARIQDMKPMEQIKAGAIMTDKGLLLSGQPTNRVHKQDERMLSDEELKKKAQEYDQRVAQIREVSAGKSA
jgi:hypothetical protein